MKPSFPIIPCVDAGRLDQIGMGYAQRGWRHLFENTKRDDPNVPTFRECADAFGSLFLHNPFGVYEPMLFDQLGESRRRAYALDPGDPEYAKRDAVNKRLDVVEFVQAARDFPHKLISYIGSPDQLKRSHANEPQGVWLQRAVAILEPYLLASDMIVFDAVVGSLPHLHRDFNGPNGLLADLVGAVRKQGVEVGVEPWNLAADNWLDSAPKVIAESQLRQRTREGWTPWPKEAGPVCPPGSHGESVMIFVRMRPEWPEQKRVDHITKLHDDFPRATPIVLWNEIPRGWIE